MSLAAALAAAQSQFPAIERTKEVRVTTRTGGQYTFNYAPLDSIMHAVKPSLGKNGLAISQLLATVDGKPALRTILLHESGETLEDVALLPVNGGESAQEIGSAITYLRRYAVVSLLGIATEEDDDGNAASGNTFTRSGAGSTAAARENAVASDEAGSTDTAPDNPAAAAQAAAEAAKAARTPTDNGDPRNVILTFGKHKNTNLGAVPSAYLEWLIGNFEAKTAEQRRILAAAQAVLAGDYPDEELPFA